MNFVPLEDGILIKRSDGESKTLSGIVLPDNAKRQTSYGKVIAVGPGTFRSAAQADRVNTIVQVGDTVYFGKYNGHDVEIDNEKFVLFREQDLLGILR